MEGNNSNGRRTRLNSREVTPERTRVNMQQRSNSRVMHGKKVQIVYYLSRNGQLEHPHFMELSQFPNQQFRLKDVLERLTLLRGKGMLSLYSWSCKRSYKNGYVWNDLSESDVVYPSDGAEYVLKGSEIIPGCYNRISTKPLAISHKAYREPEEEEQDEAQTDDTDERHPLDQDYQHAMTQRTSTVNMKLRSNHSRQIELPLDDSSPPSSSSSDKHPHLTEPGPARPSSVFLQLIACGAGAVSGGGGNNKGSGRKSGGLHRGVVSRLVAGGVGLDDELGRVSDNPRYGGLAVEDKEYFSGSIVVEALKAPIEPELKKSNSYNEERRSRLGIGEGHEEENGEDEDRVIRGTDGVKGKCIPGTGRKKNSAKLQPSHKS